MSGRPQRGSRRGSTDRGWGWYRLEPEWAERVVAAAGVRPGDLVLDLGAGTGALTAPLVRAGATVIAVELHPARAAALRRRCAGAPVTVVQADLMDLRLPAHPFRVVANPPYALTTRLVRRLLGVPRLVAADLVLQRAAGRGLAATRSRRYVIDIGLSIPRRAFSPRPTVDSAVLRVRSR